jgi:hypothetical protein
VAASGVVREVFNAQGGLGDIEFQKDFAKVCFHLDQGIRDTHALDTFAVVGMIGYGRVGAGL